jgi:hypothetical protein
MCWSQSRPWRSPIALIAPTISSCCLRSFLAGEKEVSVQAFEESTLNAVSLDNASLYSSFGFERKDTPRVHGISLERVFSQSGVSSPDIFCIDIEGCISRVLPKLTSAYGRRI